MAVTRSTQVSLNIPSWIYESLPFIYIISGLLVVVELGGGIAILSSLLLIVAGVRVLSLRRKHRSTTTKSRRTRSAYKGSCAG